MLNDAAICELCLQAEGERCADPLATSGPDTVYRKLCDQCYNALEAPSRARSIDALPWHSHKHLPGLARPRGDVSGRVYDGSGNAYRIAFDGEAVTVTCATGTWTRLSLQPNATQTAREIVRDIQACVVELREV
ncbi:hypothetical protein GCM10009765_59190 [Fodinicola feengrottensis]|uniref:HNH endonuclease n=1 Tax=Fodinicola feengrottensis TaxID=435914 RepID=A0ABN2IC08_9ACTN